MYPSFLKQGDKIIILSPSGNIDEKYIYGAKDLISSWGLNVEISKHAIGCYGRFSGKMEERIEDLQDAINDRNCKAILCSRGGYGLSQIVDSIDLSSFESFSKWILGFSDITVLHSLMSIERCASIHSIMAKHLTLLPKDSEQVIRLHDLLFGKLPKYNIASHKLNKLGNVEGVLVGGNLSVLYGLRGTPYDIDMYNKILFLEDVGERPYHIDRMMQNLRLGGILENISGLIIGQFYDCDEDPLMGKTIYESILSYVEDYEYPVCFNFPAGHVEYNLPLLLNAKVELNVTDKNVTLDFSK